MKMRRFVVILILFVGISFKSFSDSDGDSDGGSDADAGGCGPLPPCTGVISGEIPDVNCCDKIDVPFDGGVSLLIAAGIGIGVIRKRKKY
jgi:hypothetical protein